jgi:hypothetical protein
MSSNDDPNAPNTPIHKSERIDNFGVTTTKAKTTTETETTPVVDLNVVKSMIGASRNTNLENILEKERQKKEEKISNANPRNERRTNATKMKSIDCVSHSISQSASPPRLYKIKIWYNMSNYCTL